MSIDHDTIEYLKKDAQRFNGYDRDGIACSPDGVLTDYTTGEPITEDDAREVLDAAYLARVAHGKRMERINRAFIRHLRNLSPDDRATFRSMYLCDTVHDRDPIYSGTDPETGKDFEGPTATHHAMACLGQFLGSDRHNDTPDAWCRRTDKARAAFTEGVNTGRRLGGV